MLEGVSTDSNPDSNRKFRVGDIVRIKGSPAHGQKGHVIHCLSRNRYGVAIQNMVNGAPMHMAVVYGEHELTKIAEA